MAFLIYTAEDLRDIENDMSGDYVLANDIDLGGQNFKPIGYVEDGTDLRFSGTLNGNGFKIYNGTIHYPEIATVGLFVQIRDSYGGEDKTSVSNLGLEIDVTGGIRAGALTGMNWNRIYNCYSTGTVIGDASHFGVYVTAGGLIGENFGLLELCRSFGDVSIYVASGSHGRVGGLTGRTHGWSSNAGIKRSFATGNVYTNGAIAGGLSCQVDHSGSQSSAIIEDCYATGNVHAEAEPDKVHETWDGLIRRVGGLLSTSRAGATIVRRCYSTGSVTAGQSFDDIGGLVGYCDGNTQHSDNYWDVDTSGLSSSAFGEGKSTAQMHQQFTYENWDFYEVWKMEGEYPLLRGLEVIEFPDPPEPIFDIGEKVFLESGRKAIIKLRVAMEGEIIDLTEEVIE